ncbi:hypothetical protein [Marinococcus halotolerans]|uniref:hypothetical protein n=1 Tax=Marinococcus halotolerans TaxID=301092 RepID=UPI0003B61413|nr:hypothetical protein [Marinococcus halotolerans]
MDDLRSYVTDLDRNVDDLLSRLPIFDDALEARFHLVLKEKKAMITTVLDELANEPSDDQKIKRCLKIIYRDDEVEKLNFQAWKRLCQQNQAVDASVLEHMEQTFSHMKEVLEHVAEGTDHLSARNIRYVAPALYK